MSPYLRDPVSNGNPHEQALIRRWWHESEGARGRLVFEYHFEGRYADGVFFPGAGVDAVEENGRNAESRFPVNGAEIVLCEAKSQLNPEVIGQALVYRFFAVSKGATVRETIVFCETASDPMLRAAASLELRVVVAPL